MDKNQKGFGVVAIIVAIVIVGLAGTTGWLVYDRQKSKSDTQTISDEAIPTPTSSTVEEDAVETEDDTTGFLIISQLGIKIPLSGITQSDIEYTIGTVKGKNYAVAYVSSKSLKATLIEENKEYFSSYPENSVNFGTANLVMIPTANFDTDGRTSYPGDGGELDITNCEATIGDNELCVIGNFVDLGKDYIDFVQSVKDASKNAVKL